ncbi:cobyric acid synthase [Petrotoga sp. DB-2]
MAKALMIVGTGSDVGKSMVATAFCRYFAARGLSVTPFKAQNMALNSYVTIDRKEIGRAQGLQAEAAGILASAEMNPVLLKPSKTHTSQVVVLGKPVAEMNFREYRDTLYEYLKEVIIHSLNKLQEQFDLIVIEGAGSPVEMNLKDRDLVNMQVAEWADADVILVADIDRGGVFAQVVGTLSLLQEEEKKRIKGIIINKFRGDISLFQSGIEWLESHTGIPVMGVLTYVHLPEWEEEDSVALRKGRELKEKAEIDIAVIQYPYLSNYTDFVPLQLEEDVQIRYVKDVKEFGNPHVVILPGTKNTIDDYLYVRNTGLDKKISEHVEQKRELIGICGGFQMLGEKLCDPHLIESSHSEVEGLSLLPIHTYFHPEKKIVRVKGVLYQTEIPIYGYEIHMGQVKWQKDNQPMFSLEDGSYDGGHHHTLPIWGTFIHGIFDSDDFRHHWLGKIRERYQLPKFSKRVSYYNRKEQMFDRLEQWLIEGMSVEGKRLIKAYK